MVTTAPMASIVWKECRGQSNQDPGTNCRVPRVEQGEEVKGCQIEFWRFILVATYGRASEWAFVQQPGMLLLAVSHWLAVGNVSLSAPPCFYETYTPTLVCSDQRSFSVGESEGSCLFGSLVGSTGSTKLVSQVVFSVMRMPILLACLIGAKVYLCRTVSKRSQHCHKRSQECRACDDCSLRQRALDLSPLISSYVCVPSCALTPPTSGTLLSSSCPCHRVGEGD